MRQKKQSRTDITGAIKWFEADTYRSAKFSALHLRGCRDVRLGGSVVTLASKSSDSELWMRMGRPPMAIAKDYMLAKGSSSLAHLYVFRGVGKTLLEPLEYLIARETNIASLAVEAAIEWEPKSELQWEQMIYAHFMLQGNDFAIIGIYAIGNRRANQLFREEETTDADS